MSRGDYKYYNVSDKNIMYYREKEEDNSGNEEDIKEIKIDEDYEIKKIRREVKDKTIVVEYLKKQLEIEEEKLANLEIKLDELEFLEEKIKSLKIKDEE